MPIRPATPVDTPQMRSLEQQAETAAHWAEREYDALFAPEAPKRLALIADDGDAVSGFLIARCDLDEWELENVVVDPDRRRRGVGLQLVRELLHQAAEAGATSVLLEVRDSNLAARRLYEKLGFAETGRRLKYYENPREDALLLKFSVSVL
ncbi:MAG TPA: ribosomal protein S18-alanine N-acetyltransferase [Terriglobales bacterium]